MEPNNEEKIFGDSAAHRYTWIRLSTSQDGSIPEHKLGFEGFMDHARCGKRAQRSLHVADKGNSSEHANRKRFEVDTATGPLALWPAPWVGPVAMRSFRCGIRRDQYSVFSGAGALCTRNLPR
jgi:hypothetical protein